MANKKISELTLFATANSTDEIPVNRLGMNGKISVSSIINSTPLEYNSTDLTIWNNGKGNISSNLSLGELALKSNTSGYENTAIGYKSLYANTIGRGNTAIGLESLLSNTTGQDSIGVGYQALRNWSAGNSNIAIGNQALYKIGGSTNIAIGQSAFFNSTSGSYNIGIGAGVDAANFSDSILIGNSATATANNQFVVGSASKNAGSVTTEVNSSTKVWNVVINGVARKILLA